MKAVPRDGGPGRSSSLIYPTHTCFDDAMETAQEMLRLDPEWRTELRIVHGICTGQIGEHVHAWLEWTNPAGQELCCFTGIQDGERQCFLAQRAEFHRDLEVQEFTAYTVDEAWAENRRSESYGPWVDRYRAIAARASGREGKDASNQREAG